MQNVEQALKVLTDSISGMEYIPGREALASSLSIVEKNMKAQHCDVIQKGRQLLRSHDDIILYVIEGNDQWAHINNPGLQIEKLTELYLGTLGRSPQVLSDTVCAILEDPRCNLGKLNMQNNQLSDSHVAALAESLQGQRSLFQLVLSFNYISDTGAIRLARLLHQENSRVRQLDLRFNNIGEACSKYFARVLRDSDTLTLLDLRGNPLPLECEEILVASAARNYCVTTLGLPIGSSLQLHAILQRNRALFERNFGLCSSEAGVLLAGQTTVCNAHSLPLPVDPPLAASLSVLVLRGCGLLALPQCVGSLVHLRELDVSYNALEALPAMGGLSRLVLLDARFNNLQTLAPSVGDLDLLQYLYLRFNTALNFLPSQLNNCFSLEVLDLEGCPLNTLPASVLGSPRNEGRVMMGAELAELLTYLRALGNGQSVTMARVKLMVCGEEAVGKTTLLAALRNDRKPVGLATDGVDISALTIATSRQQRQQVDVPAILFDCWDYAGQQLYYSTHQFFLSPEAIYLVCFRADTFSPERVEYWLRNIRLQAPKAPLLLVATHCDLHSHSHLDVLTARFSAVDHPVYRVSSTKGDGIPGLREAIVSQAISADLVGKLLPRSWVDLEAWVLTARRTGLQPWMEFAHFQAVAEGTNVASADLKGAVDYLHKTGVVLHFGHDKQLQKWIFLAPQFIADVMSCIITLKHRLVKQGKLAARELPFAWASFPTQIHSVLLALLLNFEVVFELPGEELLVPALLPLKQGRGASLQAYDSHWCTFGRIFLFRFMPLGFFARVITRVLAAPLVRLRSVFSDELCVDYAESGAQAVLLYDALSCRLSIRAKDAPEGELLRCLVSTIEDLVDGWYPRAYCDVLVPCTHCLRECHPRAYRFPLTLVVEAVHRGDAYVRCRDIEPVRIQAIAPDLTMNYMRRKVVSWSELQMGEDLGEGSSGSVKRALWRNHQVAIKLVDQSAVGGSVVTLKDFNAEVFALSSLSHPNVVALFAICMNPLASVLEFVPFGSLWDTLTQGGAAKFSPGWERAILIDVARGMRALHGLLPPVVHRDLRSPNILISSLDPLSVKIGDLGLARQVTNSSAMRGGVLQMNSMWTAPEVLQEQSYGTSCDVYSFAMVAWECLWADARIPFAEYDGEFAGKPPQFFRDSVSSGLRPSLPDGAEEELASLVRTCWTSDPLQRPTFAQVSRALHDELPQRSVSLSGFDSDMAFVSGPQEECSSREADACARHYRQRLAPRLGAIYAMCEVAHRGELWCGDAQGSLTVWLTESRRAVSRYLAHGAPVSALCCGPPSSGSVLSAGEDGRIIRLQADPDDSPGAPQHSYSVRASTVLKEGAVFCVHWDHQAGCVWTGDSSGRLCCFSADSLQMTRSVFADGVSPVFSLLKIDANLWLGIHCELVVLDERTLIEIRRWRAHAGPVTCLLLDPTRRLCWSSGDDGDLVVHQSDTGQMVERREAHARKTTQMRAVGSRIWSVSADESVLVWDMQSRSFMFQIKGLHGCVQCLQVASDGQEVWTADSDGLIVIWSAQ